LQGNSSSEKVFLEFDVYKRVAKLVLNIYGKVKKMAIIRPFKAWRPVPQRASLIASPPYDVVDYKQSMEIGKDNPQSFIHVVRAEIGLPAGTEPYSAAVYQKAAENLEALIKNGALVEEDQPVFYAYSQRLGGHFQTGIVGCFSVDDYDSDVIKKHEKTRRDKEDDRLRHILATSAQTGPVFLMYKDSTHVETILENVCAYTPAFFSFLAPDGVEHIVHRISDPACIKQITEEVARIGSLYVADGHHRSAASSRARAERQKANPHHTGTEEYNYFMGVLFPASSLKILPYNRVVKDLNGLSKEEFLTRIRHHFKFSETENPIPAMKGHFGMYLDKRWYLLMDKPWEHKSDDPVANLDVQIMQDYLLDPVLGIKDPRTDNRISFVGGIHGHQKLKKMVDDGEGAVAFLMYPVKPEDIIAISDAGRIMPPKSTWFEPKLRSGLFIHKI